MPLDPQARAYLDQMAAQEAPPMTGLSPAEARGQMEAGTAQLGPTPEVGRVEDRTIPGPAGSIAIRITAPEGPGPFPALVYYHGGGWVLGSIATHDALCRDLSNAAGLLVVSVDYRLAPEHPFPAAVEDAYAAASWVAAHAEEIGADPSWLAVGGDSAGGNLATVVALKARDEGGPRLDWQLLLYPITDHDFDTPSYRDNAEGYMLTRAGMMWFWDHYLPDQAGRDHPYASPLKAPDLSGLPPALILTAGYDPLRDEAEAYATRLEKAGVVVRLVPYPGMIHGFVRRASSFERGRAALREIAETFRQVRIGKRRS